MLNGLGDLPPYPYLAFIYLQIYYLAFYLLAVAVFTVDIIPTSNSQCGISLLLPNNKVLDVRISLDKLIYPAVVPVNDSDHVYY
jgi:hypothetical protein